MIKTLLAQVKEYKTPSLLAPLCAALEVFFDMSVPFVIAKLIDQGVQAGKLAVAMKYGILMLVLATCGLTTGFLAGKFAAQASAGFAANLREGMYDNIQTFAFSNIDKYSTAGLVTRMTTDVTNVQNAYQMIIRIVVRAPLTIVVSMIMCFVVDQRLSLIFLAAVLILGASLLFIMRKAMTTFNYVFRKYDDLNMPAFRKIFLPFVWLKHLYVKNMKIKNLRRLLKIFTVYLLKQKKLSFSTCQL